MARKQWSAQAAAKWSRSRLRALGRTRAKYPHPLAWRLRQALERIREVQVIGYDWPVPGDTPRAMFCKAWLRLPDGREAGIDCIWPSGLARMSKHDRALVVEKREWLEAHGHPYMRFDNLKTTTLEIEIAVRYWIRTLRASAPRSER